MLPNPSSYTGHAMRRTAANVMAEAGVSSAVLKKHFNWRSENTSLKYIDNTTANTAAKLQIYKLMKKKEKESEKNEDIPNLIHIENCQNFVINL